MKGLLFPTLVLRNNFFTRSLIPYHVLPYIAKISFSGRILRLNLYERCCLNFLPIIFQSYLIIVKMLQTLSKGWSKQKNFPKIQPMISKYVFGACVAFSLIFTTLIKEINFLFFIFFAVLHSLYRKRIASSKYRRQCSKFWFCNWTKEKENEKPTIFHLPTSFADSISF